ncbi:Glycosyltransferase, GT2 family [Clostridium collagenovorans DSM 3089]|uniref:Glycosyltransferase, GT2 family n=1 Tax=Clostridium collagenovorans DSM 3089 TaxID=1121306 RepID=A0A1M5YJ81_9CLOT|nr:glycosyltransferase family 2 protein [Clostridium collagenovorans]SHI12075.1 Glycosyltransferase, GT2 family [Clostridium collagenovorans DSM 3089]
MNKKVSLIIINWNNKSYLKRCMDSILTQSYKDFEVIFIDNCSHDGSFEYFKELYENYDFIKLFYNSVNNGYAGAANQGIKESTGEYIMILNPDIIMENDFIKLLVDYIESDSSIGAVSGKLLKYDFKADQKLNYIDSAGIIMFRDRNCIDRGQNEKDDGQYEKTEQVFGVCGAAPFFKKSVLEELCINNEFFDEDFFSYKEDIDISWRINLLGYKCMYYPKAIAYHGRGMGRSKKGILNVIKHRSDQSEFLRGISLRNHIWMLYKNESPSSWKRDRFRIYFRFFKIFIYSIFFERFKFKYMKEATNSKQLFINKKKLFFTKIKDENINNLNNLIKE